MTHTNTDRPRGRAIGRLIVALVLLVLVVIFIFQNTARGRINVFFWHVTLPTWVWLAGVLVVGVLVGSLFPWFRPRRGGRN